MNPEDDENIQPIGTGNENESVQAEFVNNAQDLAQLSDVLPGEIVLMPLSQRPLFPGLTMPLQISGEAIVGSINAALENSNHKVLGAILATEYNDENPLSSKLHDIGVIFRVVRYVGFDESNAQMLIQTMKRFHVEKIIRRDKFIQAKVSYYSDPEGKPDEELKAYILAIIASVKELLKLDPLFQEQLKMLLANLSHDRPGLIMDLIASMLTAESDKLQVILDTIPFLQRAEKLMKLLQEEIQLFKLQEKIKKSIEEKISKQQKEFFLHEQLKAIKKELGLEKDDKTAEIEKFKERIEKLELTEEVQKVVDDEIQKLQLLEPVSPEYNVIRNYLDWLTILPWGVYSEDSFDIKRAQDVLDRDHYGLEDIKERIIEFISTGKKTGRVTGSILCFVGPPGVGKTSIGRSVADALNRKFYRFSVGGMRDEAEIKGHRRTYIGAMPGKFLQSLKTVGTANPIIMLDEIDKIGAGGFRGDPASALLEVLDPEQNKDFLDHYLDVRFDLSHTLFITTANQLDTIPPALLDRMEVLKLPGYITEEKIQIARRYLIPRQAEEHGLSEKDITITDEALTFIIDRYAREAGVRNLENQIKKVMRKITRYHADGDDKVKKVTADNITDFLRQPIFPEEVLYSKEVPGVVIGLAWTPVGGTTLYIEASLIKSKTAGYKQTGQLGDVMQESSEIAYSYIRSRVDYYSDRAEVFNDNFIHLHVPAGATPKDGPSAGITMALALYSLINDRPVPQNIAMTGELTLTGKVLPVGGIKEKIIAARRVGLREIILPKDNLKDYKELPDYIRAGLKCYFVNYFDDVLKTLFGDKIRNGRSENGTTESLI